MHSGSVFSVKQKAGSDWCGLACLESACRDQKKDISQSTLHDDVLLKLKQSDDSKGAMLLSLAWSVCLGNCVQSGKGEAFLRAAERFIKDSAVFITTNRDPNTGKYAGHCWRLDSVGEKGFKVMEPSDKMSEQFVDKTFEDLKTHDCVIWIITTVDVLKKR